MAGILELIQDTFKKYRKQKSQSQACRNARWASLTLKLLLIVLILPVRFYRCAVYISLIDAALQSQTQEKIGLLLVQYVQHHPLIRTLFHYNNKTALPICKGEHRQLRRKKYLLNLKIII